MAKRLDEDIKQFAQLMQERRRTAGERVKQGEIPHLNFMTGAEVRQALEHNAEQLQPGVGAAGLAALADVANYGLALIGKDDEDA